MPEFIARHVPPHITDPFTRGYMECAEWLWPEPADGQEGIDRTKVRGWSADAVRSMAKDCKAFQQENANQLLVYAYVTGLDASSAGHDFFLTRDRHGAGFWDRGDHAVLVQLTQAAHYAGGSGYPYLQRGYVRID